MGPLPPEGTLLHSSSIIGLSCHWYVIVPSPVAAVTVVNAAGVPLTHIVWAPAIVPGCRLLTVILTEGVNLIQLMPLTVAVTWRLNHVSTVRTPGA